MKITLTQQDVTAAIRLYVINQGISLANKTVTATYTSGRKENGLTAEVVITNDVADQREAKQPAPIATPETTQMSLPLEETTEVNVPTTAEVTPVTDGGVALETKKSLFGTN